ncbi:CS1-pili formation C-terminal domain-containing protein [Vibrio crassostreae]|nr:CS1-pili formation C-terminal domain-containing protein [Vibrio crassostreae]
MSCTAFNLFAEEIPDDFKHFYNFEKNTVVFHLPNDVEEIINVESNFRYINRVVDSEKLEGALLNSGIKPEKIPVVINSITRTAACTLCEVESAYDSVRNRVVVTVPASFLGTEQKNGQFTNATPQDKSLISSNRLYASGYNGDFSLSLNSSTVLGLSTGFLTLDGNLNTADDQSSADLDNLKYQLDMQGNSVSLAYNGYSRSIDNATSAFDYSKGSEEIKLSLFSTDNLLLKKKSNEKRLYFDIIADGTVDVIRNDVVIYSNSYTRGQHSISYDKLPRGNYTVFLLIKPNSYPSEMTVQRINNHARTTSLRGYDYGLSVISADKNIDNVKYDVEYLEASGVKSLLNDEVLIGSNIQLAQDEVDLGLGVNYIDSFGNISVYASILDNAKGSLINVHGSLWGLSFEREHLDLSNSNNVGDLTSVRFGKNSYQQNSLSYSTSLYGGNLSFYATKYIEDSQFYDRFESSNLSVSYQTKVFRNVSVEVGYRYNRSQAIDNVEDHLVSTSLSIPLGDSIDYRTTADYSNKAGSRFSNYLSYRDNMRLSNSVNIDATLNAAHYLDQTGQEVSFGGNTSASSDSFYSNIFFNRSTDDYTNISASFESTAVVNNGNAYFTSDKGHSYLLVENEVNKEHKNDLGLINMSINDDSSNRIPVRGDYTLVSLDDYNSYNFNIDSEVSGFRNTSENRVGSMFSYPGTVKYHKNRLREVVTFLAYFEDFNEQPLDNIGCKGVGCVSVGKVGDGVFSVSVVRGEKFKVTSNSQLCIVGQPNIEPEAGYSQCFPGIQEDIDGLQVVTVGLGNKSDEIYYLGTIEEFIPIEIGIRLEELGFKLMKFQFNNEEHLFIKLINPVKKKPILSLIETDLYEELKKTVKNNRQESSYTIIR